ncbi:hypothetical protein [uncultured Rikenella sp.]|uniref:hypothetical protein n=1 Tax=uncultured Rikenella sp. TaxID=368003 RepID=UPI00262714D2|nr:hypothetical protein [uncultured Rikenella sp.]
MGTFEGSVNCDYRPAPGFRDPGRYAALGDIIGCGRYGLGWSITATEAYSVLLNFGETHLVPTSPADRAHGLQLRCLSE